eukprot:IDg8626t1
MRNDYRINQLHLKCWRWNTFKQLQYEWTDCTDNSETALRWQLSATIFAQTVGIAELICLRPGLAAQTGSRLQIIGGSTIDGNDSLRDSTTLLSFMIWTYVPMEASWTITFCHPMWGLNELTAPCRYCSRWRPGMTAAFQLTNDRQCSSAYTNSYLWHG